MNYRLYASISSKTRCPEPVLSFSVFRFRFHLFFILLLVILALSGRADAADKNPAYKTITIQAGDSLASICRAHLGEYSSRFIHRILALNPEITDKNHIFAGDSLRLPVLIKTPASLIAKKEMDPERVISPVPAPAVIDTIPDADVPEPVAVTALTDDDSSATETDAPSAEEFMSYPPPMPGKFISLKWLSDNRALITGEVRVNTNYDFYIYVPGDLEYLQENLDVSENGAFQIEAVIGRAGRDYHKAFVMKLALMNEYGERMSEIKRTIIRMPHKIGDMIFFPETNADTYASETTGWNGLDKWVKVQAIDAMRSDNYRFKVPGGLLVPNYRYIGYNPDEKYLSWYGRVTLYGSSCMAKALLLHGDTEKAEAILRVWAAQAGPNGKIPRSANVIGDNYISPDIRSGDMAHFLGALALARAVTGNNEWEKPIYKLVNRYFMPLIDPDIGLVRGGYNGNGSQGYNRPLGYAKVPWFSAEHNFDLFQALVLISRIKDLDPDFRKQCNTLYLQVGEGIDGYLWDEAAGTFNRGWRPDTGPDRARALDCASWGALYCLKQADLVGETAESVLRSEYLKKALSCLNYAEDHFKTIWKYQTRSGNKSHIFGFRPYDGIISDIVWEDGIREGKTIDWDTLDNMVWSEGSLGVAKAWEEYARATGNTNDADGRSKAIYEQMKQLQFLSDQGGLLYSTRQIRGHFTMGEELASLAWLGYLAILHDPDEFDWERYKNIIPRVPW